MIEVGAKVRLEGYVAPIMVVIEIEDARADLYRCVWFTPEHHLEEGIFPGAALQFVTDQRTRFTVTEA